MKHSLIIGPIAKTVIILLLFSVFASPHVGLSNATSLFESNAIKSGYLSAGSGPHYLGQTFTATSTHTITSVSMYMLATQAGSQQIQVAIWNVVGGYPSSVLSSGYYTWSPSSAGNYWVTTTFSSPYTVTGGTQYAIVWMNSEYSSIVWWNQGVDYSGGQAVVESGGYWTPVGGTFNDLTFQVYGDATGSSSYSVTFYVSPNNAQISVSGTIVSNGQTLSGLTQWYPISPYNLQAGYTFTSWSSSGCVTVGSSSSSSTTMTVSGSSLTGTLTLNLNYQQTGTITFYTTPVGGSITFAGTAYTNGATKTVNVGDYAVTGNPPSGGYAFNYWATSGSMTVDSAYAQSTTAHLTGATASLTAYWTAPTPYYNVVIYTQTTGGATIGGTVYIDSDGGHSNGATVSVQQGTHAISATPPSGYTFSSWVGSGGVAASGVVGSMTVTSAGTLTAKFNQPTYTVTIYTSPTTIGSVTIDSKSTQSNGGSVSGLAPGTYSVTGNVGTCTFSSWSNAGGVNMDSNQRAVNPSTMILGGDGSVTLNLAACPVTVTFYSDPIGGTLNTQSGSYGNGQSFTALASVPYSFTLTAPNGGYQFSSFTVTGGVTVNTGQSSLIAVNTGTITAHFTVPFDFQAPVATYSSVDLTPGSSVTNTITVSAKTGSGTVVLSCPNAGTLGLVCSYNPTQGTPTFLSTLTVTVRSGATPTSGSLTVHADGSTHAYDTSFTVNIRQPFVPTISVVPTALSVDQGGYGTATVTVGVASGTASGVTLSCVSSSLPAGVTCDFTPPTGTPSFTSTVKVTTSLTTPAASSQILITTNVGTVTATLTLTVNPQTDLATDVTIKGGDGQVFQHVKASDSLTTSSPLYFDVAVTQHLSDVSSIELLNAPVGSTPTSVGNLVRGTVPNGSGFTADPNHWYGRLDLQIGTYDVRMNVHWNSNGTPTTTRILSLLNYAPTGISLTNNPIVMWGLSFASWPYSIIIVLIVAAVIVGLVTLPLALRRHR